MAIPVPWSATKKEVLFCHKLLEVRSDRLPVNTKWHYPCKWKEVEKVVENPYVKEDSFRK